MAGVLYIVATPIGNLNDISLRALEILKQVDFIAAEDTRHTRQLLSHFSIRQSLISLHDHNEKQRCLHLLEQLQAGQSIALVSDAGTPLISDPGYVLVKEILAAGIAVVPIPGACAAIAGLMVSGLPTDRFVFEGFLPAKSSARLQRLQAVQHETRTLIFYESVHRIMALITDMITVFSDSRRAVIARELTKRFETVHQGSLPGLLTWLQDDPEQQHGEFVVMLAGADSNHTQDQAEIERILKILLQQLPLKQAVSLAAEICQASRNQLYQLALQLNKVVQ